jgi:hypothetical protein
MFGEDRAAAAAARGRWDALREEKEAIEARGR